MVRARGREVIKESLRVPHLYILLCVVDRGRGRTIIGGHIFIYSCSQTVKTIDFKRN